MSKLLYFLKRNRTSISGGKIRSYEVNLEWWNQSLNIGDSLAPVLYRLLLKRRGIKEHQKTDKTSHLMTVGSLIGMGNFDSVIWGSGIHTIDMAKSVIRRRQYVRYDIRAVRGPVTAAILKSAGYKCPDVYGDPAILMPLFYRPDSKEKKYPVSLIRHYRDLNSGEADGTGHRINIRTKDFRKVIDEITSSELVISSSLHGLILAEAYGVPAVFLNENGSRDPELMKYLDWYYSTNRYDIRIARSVDEALRVSPMTIPDFEKMQKNLLEAFPYDLWQKRS